MAKNVTPRWNPYGLAGAFGIFWGVYMFLLAIAVHAGASMFWFNKAAFDMVWQVYQFQAYNPSISGAVVGLIIGFVCGAICGLILAWLYNWTSSKFPGN